MRRETQKAHKLTHPNIVRIHDFFEAEGERPFISMEFIEGANLSELRVQEANGTFQWKYLEPLVEQLCDALSYAHGEGVVHRDIKPGNVMLDSGGEPVGIQSWRPPFGGSGQRGGESSGCWRE